MEKFQQGGAAQSQQQQMIAAFAQWGAKKYGKGQMSPEQFLQQVQQLPEEQQQQLLQEFQQEMQGGVMARLGAKLEYYKKLKGVCPEGYEMKFFKKGGKMCKQCEKVEQASCGKKLKEGNAIDKFKAERAKCGSKMKKKKC